MSNFGGPSSNFEKDFKKSFGPLNKRLIKLENKLQEVMITSVKGAKKNSAYWAAVRKEINLVYAQMNRVFDKWAKVKLPMRYRNSLRLIESRIRIAKSITNEAKKSLTAVINSQASKQVSVFLYRTAANDYLEALVGGRRRMQRFIRTTQQILLDESLIDITVAQGIELGNLRKAAKGITGQLWGKLFDEVQNKQFVVAGSRKYKPSYYAELVTRTKFHEAHTQASLVEAANYSTDLLQVSTHNTTTAICVPFEGKIYSIGGRDPRFPALDDTPPYHPNCLHLLFPTFESALKVDKTLDSFSAFSRGEISRPPVPSGFIPVGDRVLV